jgi:hypothetical protein
MVLDQFPQASSAKMKRNVHDGGHKFIDGRHGTSPGCRPIPLFFSGEPLSAFFLLLSSSSADNVLNVNGNGKSEL